MGLSADGLTVTAGGATLLRDVTATLERGRVTVLLGPNGAGKSTLMRCLAGLLAPDSGAVRLDGQDIAALAPRDRARRIGYLPQSAELAWDLPAREIVALGRHPWRAPFAAPSPDDRRAIGDAMTATDTERFADRRIRTLSGGERARVLLARVLAGRPDWILADEPLASLDLSHQREMLRLLVAAARGGAGVVLVLHDLNHALSAADDALMLREGVLRHAGAAETTITTATIAEIFEVAGRIVSGNDGARNFVMPLT